MGPATRSRKMSRSKSHALCFVAAVLAGCGGRVDGSSAHNVVDASAGGAHADGGAQGDGGRQSTGGASSGGRAGSSGYAGAAGLVGSCNASFCQPIGSGAPCCVTPNGPCGVDYGRGCVEPGSGCLYDTDCPPPPVPCQPCPDGSCAPAETHCQSGSCVTAISACPSPYDCRPELCPSIGPGKGCCLATTGPCSIDFGNGCGGPLCPPDCPPPNPTTAWHEGCVPDLCQDAGLTVRRCNPASKEVAGGPCRLLGELCSVAPGCSPLLACTEDGCAIP
jgi:hypothetical protein